ncbi:hypothetical protein LQ953_13285 [Sphingomonas sp. IC-56]|uniref:hypothetical protein n=1 Tax=Sphingomonas sp. IC-56 TaxID=2898529 RepID=UPI001E565F6E|nr:hypothetical protein [Sphingomonas sp. IC-56]MCD2324991.1 hypothetical protein [Sphingomonas sp. IC-56]
MVDHDYRERVTLLLVTDALEANNGNRAEAALHLLDAAGTLIVDAQRHAAINAEETARAAAQYLIEQVEANSVDK